MERAAIYYSVDNEPAVQTAPAAQMLGGQPGLEVQMIVTVKLQDEVGITA